MDTNENGALQATPLTVGIHNEMRGNMLSTRQEAAVMSVD